MLTSKMTLSPLKSQLKKTGDSDVTAFLSATGISDPTITSAITTLVGSLKSKGLWSLMFAIYPIVGGLASTHKFNLKNPTDLDSVFRLTFFGGWTHSSTGMFPDGSTGYADTHFNTLTSGFTSISASLGYYSRTTENGGGSINRYDFSCSDASDLGDTLVICRYHTDIAYFGVGTNTYAPNQSETDGKGFFITNRIDASNTSGFKNGAQVVSVSDPVSLKSFTLYLGASNRGGSAAYFGAKQCAFAYTSSGLTSQNITDLYNAVQAFQTTLGRNV